MGTVGCARDRRNGLILDLPSESESDGEIMSYSPSVGNGHRALNLRVKLGDPSGQDAARAEPHDDVRVAKALLDRGHGVCESGKLVALHPADCAQRGCSFRVMGQAGNGDVGSGGEEMLADSCELHR
jgi:hypothetical protein